MKPCDCKSTDDMIDILKEAGLYYNGTGLQVAPPNVIIKSGPCTLIIGQKVFERLAQWYFEDQG